MKSEFDCSVDLTVHHANLAGLDRDDMVVRVREAVAALPGANWISVAWCGAPPPTAPWLRLYRPGNCHEQAGDGWDELAATVRQTLHRALSNGPGT